MKMILKKQCFLLWLVTLCSIALQAQEQKAETQLGLLWEISGGNMKTPSYLYGTMHVSQKIAFHLSDTFFIALKNVDQIALESDPSSWMEEFGEQMKNGMNHNPYGLRNNNANFYTKAFALNAPNKVRYKAYLSTESSQVNQMLYRRSQSGENFQERTYLDLFIFQAAKRTGKNVVALEDHEETMELLVKASEPEVDAADRRRESPYVGGVNFHQRIEDAYRAGNLTLLDSLHRLSLPTQRFYHYFIEERNIIMAHGMDSMMQAGTSLFTGIGAGHLPGRLGVINLLRDKGYQVRPVVITNSSKNQKIKKKIENTIVSLELKTCYPKDSAFKVDFPGKLYEARSSADATEYLYPDMINGAFFSISRIHSYGALSGNSEELNFKIVDSLLFENIPGDIEKKTISKKNGFQTIDITNKTRTGDYQRYQIIFTPLEIYFFKVGGNGKYALSSDVTKFFNSIEIFGENLQGNKSVKPQYCSVEARMYPMQIKQDFAGNFNASRPYQIQAFDHKKQRFQLLMAFSLNDINYIEEDSFEMVQLTKEFAKQFDYQVANFTISTHQGYPAIEALLTKDSVSTKFLKTKVILEGTRYHLAVCNHLEDAASFFESIQFKNIALGEELEYYYDSLMLFSVKTTPREEPSLMDMLYYYGYEDYFGYEENQYEPDYFTEVFYSEKTNESIHLAFNTFGKYAVMDEAAFWEKADETLTKQDPSMEVVLQKKYEEEGMLVRDLILVDSNSAKRIKVKEILNRGAFYSIRYCTDSISELSPFAKTFFETFSPAKDTFIDNNIFEPKGLQLLADLRSKDSLTLEMAKALYKGATFLASTKGLKDSLVAFLNTYPFDASELTMKSHLIEELSLLEDSSVTDELIQLYKNAAGKTTTELACLNALASRSTKKDYDALLLLAKSGDLPLPFYEKDLKDIFRELDDSLELAVGLFPDLFQYLSYPEYKDKIFGLLADLVHHKIVDASIYALQKKRIIREAINGLKRQLAGEEKKKEIYFDENDRSYYQSSFEERRIEYLYASKLNTKPYINQYSTNATVYSQQLIFLTKLMLPLYEEEAAKPFFDQLFTIKSADLLLKISDLLIKDKKPVPDSLWGLFSQHASTRIPAYIILKEAGRLDLFDTTYLNQEMFMASLLDFDYEMDTIAFVDKKLIQYKGNEGYLYFFKKKTSYNNYSTLECVGPQPIDSTQLSTEGLVVWKRNIVIKNEKEVDLLIQEQLEQLENKRRKRMGEQRSYY